MTTPDFNALARALLDRRLQRSGSDAPDALRSAFNALAPVAGLDQALAAGQPVDQTLPVILTALAEATGATTCRLLLRADDGGYVRMRQDGSAGPEPPLPGLAGVTGAALEASMPAAFQLEDVARMAPATDWIGARPPASLACAPLPGGNGVLQLFDSSDGRFTASDLTVAESAASGIGALLEASQEAVRLVRAVATEAASGPMHILARILAVALRVLSADRGWILLHDAETNELRSVLSEGLGGFELRLSASNGVAATAFRDGSLVNIAEAYQDPRFNPALDRALGYRTRTVLCVPVEAAEGHRLGVVQMVNRRGGPFTREDEENIKALAAQVGVTVEYGTLFEQVSRMKAANESMLRSLSNGVLTVGMDGAVGFVNGAAARILRMTEDEMLGRPLDGLFDELNAWMVEAVEEVQASGEEKQAPDSELYIPATDEWVPVNLSILPLQDARGQTVGIMLLFEDLQRERELRRTMSRYVSNNLIDRLMAGGDALLNGASQPVTTLFSDIRGFSSLSETIGAAGTVTLLNDYFSYMEDVVSNRAGVVDKYIGDAVMALFGVPFPEQHDAENAVQAAADMLHALVLLNSVRAEAGQQPLRIGIGLASGPVVVGNIGSPRRMDFTVIGDPVNLASRLESCTKRYGADILFCGQTMKGLLPGRKIRRIDIVRVVGQEMPTEVFELMDHRVRDWGGRFDEAMDCYAAGLDHYIRGNWDRALPMFEEAYHTHRQDKAAALLIDRCRGLILQPPDAWDGTFTLTEK
jgi:adenylate cyclase